MAPAGPLIAQLIDMDVSTLPGPGFLVPQHLHHFHQLDVILRGEVLIGLEGGEQIAAGRGTAVLIPPLCSHGYRSQRGFAQVTFKLHLAPACWPLYGRRPLNTSLPACRLNELEEFGRQFRRKASLLGPYGVAVATLCLISLAQSMPPIEVRQGDSGPFAPRLWQLLEEVEARPFEAWPVARLAKECHLSVDHFSRLFTRLLATTPQKYLLEARMRAAAAELVNDSDIPIKQIAERAGYSSVHAFSRAFKGVLGIAPAAYRHAPRQL